MPQPAVSGGTPKRRHELGGPVHVLVGRDVLRFCLLLVDGIRGDYTLAAREVLVREIFARYSHFPV